MASMDVELVISVVVSYIVILSLHFSLTSSSQIEQCPSDNLAKVDGICGLTFDYFYF